MEQTFLEYVKGERKKFSKAIGEDWLMLPPSKRVIIENLLIAYDQMTEFVEKRQPEADTCIHNGTHLYKKMSSSEVALHRVFNKTPKTNLWKCEHCGKVVEST